MKVTEGRFKLYAIVGISFLTGLIITLVQFRSSGHEVQPRWTTIAFQNVPVQVQFPALPRHRVEQITLARASAPVPQGIFTAQGADGVLYSVSVITYPEEALPPQEEIFLRNEIGRLFPGAALVSFEAAPFSYQKGIDARDFVMQNNAEGTYVQGRIIANGGTVYTSSVIYPNGYFPEKNYQRFINSFVYAQ